MKDKIIVRVSDIRSVIQDVRRSGCDIVSLSIFEQDEYDGDVIPASIQVSACKAYSPNLWNDFDPVYAIPNEAELEEAEITSPHMGEI